MMNSESVVVEVKDTPMSISRLKRMIVSDVDRALLSTDCKGKVYVTWQLTSEPSDGAESVEVVKVGRSSRFVSTLDKKKEPIDTGDREEPQISDEKPNEDSDPGEDMTDEEVEQRRLDREKEKLNIAAELDILTVPALKKLLVERKLDVDGLKEQLIQRLVKHGSEVQD